MEAIYTVALLRPSVLVQSHLDPSSVDDLSVKHGKDDLSSSEDDGSDAVHALEEREVPSVVETLSGAVKEASPEEDGPEDEDSCSDPEGDADALESKIVVGVPADGRTLVRSDRVGTLGVDECEEGTANEEEGVDPLADTLVNVVVSSNDDGDATGEKGHGGACGVRAKR